MKGVNVSLDLLVEYAQARKAEILADAEIDGILENGKEPSVDSWSAYKKACVHRREVQRRLDAALIAEPPASEGKVSK